MECRDENGDESRPIHDQDRYVDVENVMQGWTAVGRHVQKPIADIAQLHPKSALCSEGVCFHESSCGNRGGKAVAMQQNEASKRRALAYNIDAPKRPPLASLIRHYQKRINQRLRRLQ